MKTTNMHKIYTSPATVITLINSYAVLQSISGLHGMQDGGQATEAGGIYTPR